MQAEPKFQKKKIIIEQQTTPCFLDNEQTP
jgi:hypothetical protein